MFRTKSLNNTQMKNLIERNRPSRIQKQNRNYSLRTLISDKTIQYQKHMERLVRETNEIIYSNKKSNKKSTSQEALDDISHSQINHNSIQEFNSQQIGDSKLTQVKEFEYQGEIHYVQVQTLPTYLNQKTIQEENEPEAHSCMERSQMESENKSAFKVSLENQQLSDENRQLRRQIQNLQQRLESAQLLRIQKESESESLKLKIKILQLKILDHEEKNEQKRMQFTKFTINQTNSIVSFPKQKVETQTQTFQETSDIEVQTSISTSHVTQTQTQQTGEHIDQIIKTCKYQTCKLEKLTSEITQFELFVTNFRQKMSNNAHRRGIIKDAESIFEKVNELFEQQRQMYESALAKQKEKYVQMEEKSMRKISTLTNLLGLAQNEIKTLLVRLRQAKIHDVASYKQMMENLCKNQNQLHQYENKQQ